MTLFTKDDCVRCARLKRQFNLAAMEVRVEVLDDTNSSALAHLAWHSLVEVARKNLPVLVLDDSSTEADFGRIEHLLTRRAIQYGVVFRPPSPRPGCESGQCRMN
ncbi:MAG: hypothetical protein A2521_09980 [Deltaproteobacteria bacterium RIFOXYD12_FULL_57_12]|nr:MAG: hypothetical protein A2521_09980 [Deltaproteobacteria bacterium RIFOXYD12_FULL_57_12]